MGLDPQLADRYEPLAFKPLVGHPGLGGQGLGQMPVAFATDCRQDRLPFARPQGQQIPNLGARVAPLIPLCFRTVQAPRHVGVVQGRLPSDSPSRDCPCLAL